MTPIFDELCRQRGIVYIPRPLGALDRPRLVAMPPLVVVDDWEETS